MLERLTVNHNVDLFELRRPECEADIHPSIQFFRRDNNKWFDKIRGESGVVLASFDERENNKLKQDIVFDFANSLNEFQERVDDERKNSDYESFEVSCINHTGGIRQYLRDLHKSATENNIKLECDFNVKKMKFNVPKNKEEVEKKKKQTLNNSLPPTQSDTSISAF